MEAMISQLLGALIPKREAGRAPATIYATQVRSSMSRCFVGIVDLNQYKLLRIRTATTGVNH